MTRGPTFLGIDFGTSQSSMAWYRPGDRDRAGQAEVLYNAEGQPKTPSVVYFGADRVLVGAGAEQMLENDAERKRVVVSVKRDLAESGKIALPGKRVTSVEVAAEVLRKLKHDAEELHFREALTHAVLTHPATFDQTEKDRLTEAARLAGFAEVRLLSEPVAAALAYAQAGMKVGRHILVYDLGGGTFDLALLVRDEDGAFRLAAEPRGCRRCGGDDFDRALYEHCDEIAEQRFGRPISLNGTRNLHFLRTCRERKEQLSVHEKCQFNFLLPSEQGPLMFQHSVSRSTFEELILKQLQDTVRLTRTLANEARSRGHRIDSVVLIGGSSRLPVVRTLLQETLGAEPLRWQQQDLAVALGAAYEARRIWGLTPEEEAEEIRREEQRKLAEKERIERSAREERERAEQLRRETEQRRREKAQRRAAILWRCRCWFGTLATVAALLLVFVVAADICLFFTKASRAEINVKRARELLDKGDADGAIAAANRALTLNPNLGEAYAVRGGAYLRKKDDDRALDDCNRAIEMDRYLAEAFAYRGEAHLRKRDFQRSVADCTEAVRLHWRMPDALMTRSLAHRETGDLVNHHLDRGRAFGVKNEADLAIVEFTEAIRLQPDCAEAFARRGAVRGSKRDYDEGLADCNRAIQLNPRLAIVYEGRAAVYSWKGDHDKAIQDYTSAIAIDPTDIDRLVSRGFAYVEKQQFDLAAADCNQALRLNPRSAGAYLLRAWIATGNKEYKKALPDYDRAVDLDPGWAAAYGLRGANANRKEDYDRAITDCNKAVELDPKYASGYAIRGDAYLGKKDYERAVTEYTTALGLDPKNPYIYGCRGNAYCWTKQFDRSVNDFNRAIALKPDYAWFYMGRSAAYNQLGNLAQSQADYNEAIRLDPSLARKS
jgi:tetratricopeptide (TPR) repeat protein